MAARVKLCRVWIEPDGRFRKKRRFLADLWVGPLNTALAIFGIALKVLDTDGWLTRERAILGSTLGRWVCIEDGILTTEPLSGCCLWQYLRRPDADVPSAIEAAGRALRALHDAGVTHSDAALHNALYDPTTATVAWLDFETRYRSDRPLSWCQAHDLAALLASAIKALPPHHLDSLPSALRRGYGSPERIAHAAELLGTVPVLLIVETPWSLQALESVRASLSLP
jgi:hypothetical protein